MADLNDIFKSSDSLAAEDLQGNDVVLTIKEVEIVEFEDDGRKKQKPVLHFNETEKTLVSNKTNSMMIAEHYGYETSAWAGEKITLYPTKTDFGGKIVDCIRVRAPESGKTVSQGLPGHQTGGMGEASMGHVNQDIPPAE